MNVNVLIFPAGAENALEIYDSLKYNLNVTVYGASGKKDFAEYKYPADKYIEGNFYVTDQNFDKNFQQIIEKYKIDVVIPTHDTIALYFAKNRDKFSAKILVADYFTADICRYKSKTYDLFKHEDFCPVVFDFKNLNSLKYPVFVKPDVGAGAVGAKLCHNVEELSKIENIDSYVICENLPGQEFSVDCFTSTSGKLNFVGPRSRDRICHGIAYRSTTAECTEEIRKIAEKINCKLHFLGAWYFQIKKDINGKFKLLEISCRQAGTMTLSRHMGINFAMLGIFELMGISTSYVKNPGKLQVERCLKNAFKYDYEYQNIYIDFDDTITIKNFVNPKMMSFLYQCKNEGKKIILLTRHEGNLEEILGNLCIPQSLFSRIIHIDGTKEKKSFIQKEKSIFIDNSFAERKAVFDEFGIPVFDVDMIDMLIDESKIFMGGGQKYSVIFADSVSLNWEVKYAA